jgi:tetratricopeptide (TPR) repeat protein
MSLRDVYEGRLTWADYLRQRAPEMQTSEAALQVRLSDEEHRLIREAGLGALQPRQQRDPTPHTVAFDATMLAQGVAQLKADFLPLLGDAIWKLELQHATTSEILEELRLAEFEREARAYRTRAERAYLNGWYEEALNDFLAAEARNYPDYAVLRSIANIYLYHVIDLPQALEYFRKAAKYARPVDARQAAEAHFFAALVCNLQQQPAEALTHLQAALELQPQFAEAQYQYAAVAATLQQTDEAIHYLEQAISGDARYYERAKTDAMLDAIRAEVKTLLDRLVQPVTATVEQVRQDAAHLQGYVIVEEEKQKLAHAFRSLEQPSPTYREQLQKLELVRELQHELAHLHERFDKHYAIDPRDYVRSIAFSHDGQTLAAGFLNGGVQLWEVDSMQQRHAFLGHYASVNSVAFSPNDLLLATASRDRDIKLWEPDSGAEIQKLRGHSAEVRAVSFSPDGQWLVSGSHDTTIRIWRVATGHEVETLHGHQRPVTSVVFSPDGQWLASGSWDHTIRLWDLQAGRPAKILHGHRIGVASLVISPDGHWLASGSEKGEVKLWDLAAGREVRSFHGLLNSVTSVAFSPDGSLLAAGSLGVRIMVWQRDTAAVVRKLEYESISYNSVAFSPRGQWLAFGNRDLQLWLKVILTEDEYAAVKAGEERALRAAQERERLRLGYVPMHKK